MALANHTNWYSSLGGCDKVTIKLHLLLYVMLVYKREQGNGYSQICP